jgi:glycogen(starch) synthase
LAHENTNVLFVVPKLYGDEPAQDVELISASEVPVIRTHVVSPRRERESIVEKEVLVETEATGENIKIKVIEVASSLQPYQVTLNEEVTYAIERWNHRFQTLSGIKIPVVEIEEAKIETEEIHYSLNGGYGSQLIREVYRYAEVAETIAAQNKFDVIHAHDWMTFPAAVAAKKISGKPLIIHIHATEHDRALNGGDPIVYNIEKLGMDEADRVVAVSKWTRNLIIERYRIPAEKISVVHNGITLSNEFKESSPSPIGSKIVTFMGRITHQKGPAYFVDAAKLVSRKFPDAHFVIAGSGDLLPQIVERVARLKLSSRFHFTGFLKKPEIDRILSFSSVYVMPSVSEPFGITPLEAINAGVPVIISNQSGVAEVMQHALKVDFWDSQALANAICSVLQYESLSTTLIKNGGKEIKEITWNKAAKKLKTIYHELTQ